MNVGEFYMQGDRLVEIAEVTGGGRAWVNYTGANYPAYAPTDPFPGGGSSGTWGPEDFRPVTDPILLMRIELTKAHRQAECAKSQLKDALHRFRMLRYAIGVATPAPDAAEVAPEGAGPDQ